jgi:hypothetical protein
MTLIDMARTMLDEYKTLDLFSCEAINTACHAINRLYLHKKLKKTSYELLTSNKLRCHTLEYLGLSVLYLTRDIEPLNLHLKLMKAFFLVIDQMSMPTVSSTCNTPGVRLAFWHLHCMSLSVICSYMSMEHM